MGAIHVLLSLFCVAAFGSPVQPSGHLLRGQNDLKRSNIVQLAQRETGVREIGNTNRGKRVEEYLAYVSLKGGEPWCAAYISWIYGKCGYVKPRSAWSPDLLPTSRLVKSPLPADVFGIYFPELKRIAHVGIVVSRDGDWILGSEGNTNVDGSREGNGVYLKRRHIRTIAKYADWVTNGKEVGQ